MSFSETIFLFFLALIIFGPKKLPEIARQAGRLLAELRRASNEFKSQIETEIAHLEVEKKQEILPPAVPPPGAVASLSLNPAASEVAPHELPGTLAAPTDGVIADSKSADSSPAVANAAPETSTLSSVEAPVASPVSDPASSSATQDSHV
ncbi:MAG: twin-arginine translocase TatA/TatE family subunit [Candidatus Sulfotelmatobacter sp.]|jgi:sec-independent protein translocase protein TatB